MSVRIAAAIGFSIWIALALVRAQDSSVVPRSEPGSGPGAVADEPALPAVASDAPAHAALARDEPQPTALARDDPPDDPLAAVLDAEAERLRERLGALESRSAAAEAALEREQAEHAAGTERIVSLAETLAATPDGSAEVSLLYGEIVAALTEIRPRLAADLQRWREPIEVPAARSALDEAVRAAPAYTARKPELDALQAAIDAESERVRRAEQAARWAAVDLRAIRTERLNAIRVDCLARLGFVDRQRILSLFSQEGIAQLRREVQQLALSLRVYAARREHRLDEIPERMKDVFRIGSLTWTLAKVVALVVALIWLRGRWGQWIERTRQALFRSVRSVRGKRRVETLLGAVEVLGPWSAFLAALVAARALLGPLGDAPEAQVTYGIAFAYGAYRLGIDAAFALISSGAARYRLSMDASRRRKLFLGVRAVARLVAAVVVLLSFSALLLGKGYLYHFISRFAWFFAVVIAIRLLGGWRQEIGDAYLKVQPAGSLADAVRATRQRWYGIFVAGASFGWLFGRGVAVLARDFALGFDQTRRALAFLFRRRIEKQAEQRGYAESSPESLPAPLVAAFCPEPVSDGELVVDHFPGFRALEEAIAAWQGKRGGAAFLIRGEPGIGKTSWLGRVRAEGLETTAVALADRPRSAARLAEMLAAALLPRGAGATPVALAAALDAGPPRIVTLDLAQNLFLGTVGGYEPFVGFAELVTATAQKVFWVCSFNEFAWRHLSAVRPELSVFCGQAALAPWSEPLIRDLIRARLRASGVKVTYEDLVLDRMEGVSAKATLVETEEGYTRLLWDYADGSPRVALHFWLRSVVPESERRVRVRLFRAPDPGTLEQAGQAGLFVLAAVANHENLTLDEAAEVSGLAPALCRIHIDRFREYGVLTEAAARYRVSTHWLRTTIRLLRRQNLLAD